MPSNQLMRIGLSLLLVTGLSGCGDEVDGPERQGYAEAQYIYLSTPVAGQLKQLTVSRGQAVKKGQIIFALDPQPEQSTYEAAQSEAASLRAQLKDLEKGRRDVVIQGMQAQLAQAEAKLLFAKRDFLRVQALFKQAAVDHAQLDQSKSHYEVAMGLVRQLSAQLKEARMASRVDLIAAQHARLKAALSSVQKTKWALEQKIGRAPVDGTIVETYYLPGEFVGNAAPVVSLFDPHQMRVIFFVTGEQLARVKIGTKVSTTCDGCQAPMQATVSYISPQTEYTPPVIYSREHNEKLLYRAKAKMRVDQATQYHPGQPVTVNLNQAG